MLENQILDWINAVIVFVSASVGALVGVFYQHRISRARPRIHVTSCELSSYLLSRVDYLELPDSIATKFKYFPWTVNIDGEQISSSANTLPIGNAQENFYYLREFIPKIEEAQDLINEETKIFKSGTIDEKKESMHKILSNITVLRSMLGRTRRGSFSIFTDQKILETINVEKDNTTLPWALDDASGVGKGTIGAYTIHLPDAIIAFPFQWEIEKRRMQAISFLLAHLHEKAVLSILKETLDELSINRAIANDLYLWFSENIDENSTIVCNATISNLGRSPTLFSGKGILKINMPEGKIVNLPCSSEVYTQNSEEENSVKRTVKVLGHISKLLDIAIPVRRRTITEKILVPGSEFVNISLRTDNIIKEISESKSILNLYKSKKLTAKLILLQEIQNTIKKVESSNFIFASSVE